MKPQRIKVSASATGVDATYYDGVTSIHFQGRDAGLFDVWFESDIIHVSANGHKIVHNMDGVDGMLRIREVK